MKVSDLFKLYLTHSSDLVYHANSRGSLPEDVDLADRAIQHYLMDWAVTLYNMGDIDIDQVWDCFNCIGEMTPKLGRILYAVVRGD